MLSLSIEILEAMITLPNSDNLASKRFHVEVESDDKFFTTEAKQGSCPKFNHKDSITSRNGVLTFKLFEKSGKIS